MSISVSGTLKTLSIFNLTHVLAASMVVGLLVCLSGCTGTEPDSADPKTGEESKEVPKTTSVLPEAPTTSPSPAAPAMTLTNAPANLIEMAPANSIDDTSPVAVCGSFMELLQSGNRLGAENLLTHASISNITAAGLKLEPMGGPNAKYEIGNIQYATTKERLAHVNCLIKEEVDGKTVEMNIAWQCRKFKDVWRISGVILENKVGQAPDLLSFENLVDVTKIQSMASEDVLNEGTSRQASLKKEIK